MRLDHVIDGPKQPAELGDSARNGLQEGRPERGATARGPVASAVRERRKDLGLVEENVAVDEVAEFAMNHPVEIDNSRDLFKKLKGLYLL